MEQLELDARRGQLIADVQAPVEARLNAMNRRFKNRLPWTLTCSFSRAIQQPALEMWRAEPGNVQQAQRALLHRAACNRAARRGEYTAAMDRAT